MVINSTFDGFLCRCVLYIFKQPQKNNVSRTPSTDVTLRYFRTLYTIVRNTRNFRKTYTYIYIYVYYRYIVISRVTNVDHK